jgi:hypothetical protein
MLEDVQRRLGVAAAGGVVQHLGHFGFTLGAALLFSILRNRVKLHEPPIFGWRHASGVGERVALQPFAGGQVDALQNGFRRLYFARLIR